MLIQHTEGQSFRALGQEEGKTVTRTKERWAQGQESEENERRGPVLRAENVATRL